MYVDDHAEIHTITKIPQIQALIQPILEVQQDWGFSTNMSKSFALIKLQGRGCRKKLKNIDGKVKLEHFGKLKIAAVENT